MNTGPVLHFRKHILMAVEKAGWEGGNIQSREASSSSIVEKQGAKA